MHIIKLTDQEHKRMVKLLTNRIKVIDEDYESLQEFVRRMYPIEVNKEMRDQFTERLAKRQSAKADYQSVLAKLK